VEAGDSVRFAVYPENDMNVIYLLNTDSGRELQVLISAWANKKIPVMLRVGEMLAVYCTERCLVIPAKADSRITGIRIEDRKLMLSKYREADKIEEIACFVDGCEYVDGFIENVIVDVMDPLPRVALGAR
jgi:hypothetical protein